MLTRCQRVAQRLHLEGRAYVAAQQEHHRLQCRPIDYLHIRNQDSVLSLPSPLFDALRPSSRRRGCFIPYKRRQLFAMEHEQQATPCSCCRMYVRRTQAQHGCLQADHRGTSLVAMVPSPSDQVSRKLFYRASKTGTVACTAG